MLMLDASETRIEREKNNFFLKYVMFSTFSLFFANGRSISCKLIYTTITGKVIIIKMGFFVASYMGELREREGKNI